MAQKKYAKHFIEIKAADMVQWESMQGKMVHCLEMHKAVFKGAPNFITIYMAYASGACVGYGEYGGGGKMAYVNAFPHKHPVYETNIFLGTDPHNPDDLGGEIEYWLGEGEKAEKYVITKPTCIIVPKNTIHYPLYYRRVDRPIFQMEILPLSEYKIEMTDKLPPGFKKPQ